jgi:hypothetical protein
VTLERFSFDEVVSITTGVLLCGMDGVYRILNHMTGRDLLTHELPSVVDVCRAALLEQFPRLAGIEVPDESSGDGSFWKAWADKQRSVYGDEFYVAPLNDR